MQFNHILFSGPPDFIVLGTLHHINQGIHDLNFVQIVNLYGTVGQEVHNNNIKIRTSASSVLVHFHLFQCHHSNISHIMANACYSLKG